MNPTHRVIITPAMLDSWFNKIADAHRNPSGAFYELDDKKVAKALMLGLIHRSGKDAVFLISKASDLVPGDPGADDLYLTILDWAYWEQVDEVRWKIRLSDSYWHTGKLNPPVAMLHQYVFQIAHGQTANNDIHHRNFFTFDNRAENLVDLTTANHAAIHASAPNLDGCFVVNSDKALYDLIDSVL